MNPLFQSSTGEGVKLRIKAFIPLLVPVINTIGQSFGVNLIPENLDTIVDAVFILAFAVMQIIGWVRALRTKQ